VDGADLSIRPSEYWLVTVTHVLLSDVCLAQILEGPAQVIRFPLRVPPDLRQNKCADGSNDLTMEYPEAGVCFLIQPNRMVSSKFGFFPGFIPTNLPRKLTVA
jgi:hypothetical protein